MSRELLIALYENKRLIILSTFLNHPDNVDPALAFAYTHRLAPIFHESIFRETHEVDPYEEIYSVKSGFMNDVLTFIDKNDLANTLENIAFYDLEQEFSGRGNRMDILFTIEYARIGRRFGDKVYDAITSNAPTEANKIDATFEPKDVHISQ